MLSGFGALAFFDYAVNDVCSALLAGFWRVDDVLWVWRYEEGGVLSNREGFLLLDFWEECWEGVIRG